jgi:hypothetical protein
MLKLTEPNHGRFETKARIVWQGDGMAPDKQIVGALLGVSFLEVSPDILKKIQDLYLLPDVDFVYSEGAPTAKRLGSRRNGHNGNRINGSGPTRHGPGEPIADGNGRVFDLLIDPAIEQLLIDDPGDRERELDEIRQKLQPYLL